MPFEFVEGLDKYTYFSGATWPCGHEKTEANTQSVGKAGKRCRICRRNIALNSLHEKLMVGRQ